MPSERAHALATNAIDATEASALRDVAAYLDAVVDAVTRLELSLASEPLQLPRDAFDAYEASGATRGGTRLLDLENATTGDGRFASFVPPSSGARILDLDALTREAASSLSPSFSSSLSPSSAPPFWPAAATASSRPPRGGSREIVLESQPPAMPSFWPQYDAERVSGFRFRIAPEPLAGTGTDDD